MVKSIKLREICKEWMEELPGMMMWFQIGISATALVALFLDCINVVFCFAILAIFNTVSWIVTKLISLIKYAIIGTIMSMIFILLACGWLIMVLDMGPWW